MQFIGNAWDLPSLQAIIALGMVLSIVPLVSLFFFDDDKTLGHESEALLESEQPGKASQSVGEKNALQSRLTYMLNQLMK